MSRVVALIVGIPLAIYLVVVLVGIIRGYLAKLDDKDFVSVGILRERDKLEADVKKYILDLYSISEKPSYALHEKFLSLKEAKTIPQIEFATDELEEEFEKELRGLDPVIKKFLGR